jgi:uncharacterized protein (TIGR03032 family)
MPQRHAESVWRQHAREWRAPAQIVSQWREADAVDRSLLQTLVSRGWWPLLERLGITLLATREYEHLAMAMSARGGRPRISFAALPHPSGLVADRTRRQVLIASTRNPNQLYRFAPLRLAGRAASEAGYLAPIASTFYPGRLYLHDLALIGGRVHANAVGLNAVVRLEPDGRYTPVWWPKSIERRGRPDMSRNYIQLNSIAAGRTVRDSYFSASSTSRGRLRPGHVDYPVDRRGVVFSGRTREPICDGLTRPHSARLQGRTLWVANSGYGEVGIVRDGALDVIQTFRGWTRGLCVTGPVAFVGTSRVIPKFAKYAPGLDVRKSVCGITAIDTRSGHVLASLEWPSGNQIFAIDWMPDTVTPGFFFSARRAPRPAETAFFYDYAIDAQR